MFKQARQLLQSWLEDHLNTPVRLLGVGVSGLESPDARGISYDLQSQKALDRTLDEIKQKYGEDKAMRALALRMEKKNRQ